MAKGTANTIILVGNLGDDPEVVELDDGDILVKLSVATTDGFGKREGTNWHKVLVFGKTAEFCEKYLRKGDKVWVDGYMSYRKYTDRDDIKRISAEVISQNLTSISSGGSNEGSSRSSDRRDRDDDRDDDRGRRNDRGRDRDSGRSRSRSRSRDRDDDDRGRGRSDRSSNRDRGGSRNDLDDEIPF